MSGDLWGDDYDTEEPRPDCSFWFKAGISAVGLLYGVFAFIIGSYHIFKFMFSGGKG